MKAHVYLRASTKDQDADRARAQLLEFAHNSDFQVAGIYGENISGTKLQRPQLMNLLAAADPGDVLLVESIDRLSRLSQSDWARLKQILAEKQLRLIVVDLPTTHLQADSSITGQIMTVINDMLIDLTSTMARLDQEKRVERIRQGLANKRAQDPSWTPPGKQRNAELWHSIERLMNKLPSASVDEIATLASCGVATVYRVKKSIKDRNERNSV